MSGMNCDKLESQIGEVEEGQSAVAFGGPGVAALCVEASRTDHSVPPHRGCSRLLTNSCPITTLFVRPSGGH